jgi:serine protease
MAQPPANIRALRRALGALAGLVAAAAIFAAPAAAGAEAERAFVPGEVVVATRAGDPRVVELPAGVGVREAIDALREDPRITYANPNWVATAALTPLDRGSSGEVSGWREDQWSFRGRPGGVRVAKAWDRAQSGGAAGGAGVTVAVVDSGIAYAGPPPDGFARSPDFRADQFADGVDLVDGDPYPVDENGHGTHVAGTIGEQVTLGQPVEKTDDDFLTGLAYGATLMPVRVLDRSGAGTSEDVAEGVEWAARHGADVINLSLQFARKVKRCKQVKALCKATRKARRRGALVIAAAGNATGRGKGRSLFPAAAPGVLSVAAATRHGCLAAYSHYGKGVDLTAPGGGRPRGEASRKRCRSDSDPVKQLSFECFPDPCLSFDQFAIRPDLGTSMSAAHASGVAALVLGSGAAGPDPSPKQLRSRLLCSARPAKPRRFYGAGLLDAARATRSGPCEA